MTFNKNLLTATLLTVAGLTAVSSANAAGSVDSTFAVTLEIDSVCTVDATKAVIDFKLQDAGTDTAAVGTAGVGTSTGAIEVICSLNAPYMVNLTPGNVGTTTGAGTMNGPGSDTIDYQLYSKVTAAEGEEWGSTGILGGELSNGVAGTGAGLSNPATTHSVYARLTSTTDIQIGEYSDIVTAYVTY